MEVSGSVSNPSAAEVFFSGMGEKERDRVRLKRKTLEAVLEQCQRALELLSCSGGGGDDDESDGMDEGEEERGEEGSSSASGCAVDRETDELCDLIKSRVECPDFLERIEHAQALIPQNSIEDGSSWDIVNENDLWEDENIDADKGDYVLVRQEDIIEGIASFMAAYLLSLKQKKELTPNQLQDALSRTFSLKKKKGKLRKAWDGSKVIYNLASWSATAIGALGLNMHVHSHIKSDIPKPFVIEGCLDSILDFL